MKSQLIRKTLQPQDIELIIDSREQLPLDLQPFRTRVHGLVTGDYSITGLERRVACERKSLQDLIMCVGKERERFEREIQRLLGYETRAIFVEGSWKQIENKEYRGEVHPNAAMASVMGWMARGIPIMFCSSAAEMSTMLKRFMFVVAQRHWREFMAFNQSVASSQEETLLS